jgi:NAD+ kinase
VIRVDTRNPAARALHEQLGAHLPAGAEGDLVVVVGGDGYLLRTVSDLGTEPVFFALNAGHLGFLLNDATDWPRIVDAITRRDLRVFRFPLLHATITRQDGSVVEDRAINDVYLERASGQTARLVVHVDGQLAVDPLVADGLIFATALGSTAYSFSAGGVACHPELPILAVTPICPHHPRLYPFALPASSRARVDVRAPDRRPVRAVVDGRATEHVQSVEIAYHGETVSLAYLPERDFTSRMISKLLRP